MQFHRAPSPSTATLLLACALAACSSNHPEPPFVSGMIDAAGGTLEVAEGNQAGTRVDVPADSLSAPTELSISRGFPSQVPGFLPLGRAVHLGPSDVDFALPAQLTLLLSASPSQNNPIVILQRAADGTVLELGPITADDVNNTVSGALRTFSTVWPAERTFGGAATSAYLPFQSGNVWNLEQDLEVTLQVVFDEPNLDGQTIYRLVFATPEAELGHYLQFDFMLGVVSLGVFSSVGDDSFQILHEPMPFLQSSVTLGQMIESLWTYTLHTPYGATEPTGSGVMVQRLVCAKPREIEVPAGVFENLLLARYRRTATDTDGTARSFDATYTLGADVGFLTVEALGLSARLESGTVGGDPIGDD